MTAARVYVSKWDVVVEVVGIGALGRAAALGTAAAHRTTWPRAAPAARARVAFATEIGVAGADMPTLTASHNAVSTSPNPKTAAAPCHCDSQPPAAAPAKVPRNCTLEYTPVAVPLIAGGANLETSEGSVASSRLNPVKKT